MATDPLAALGTPATPPPAQADPLASLGVPATAEPPQASAKTPPTSQHDPFTDMAIGAVKGLGQDADAAAHVLHKMGTAVPMPGHMSDTAGEIIPEQGIKAMDTAVTPTNTGQRIGASIEQAGEFMAGDEALAGLAKMGKIPEGVLAMAEKYPKTAKILMGTGKVAKTSGEGAAQGAVHGAAEGKSGEEAEGGAIGGALGESATQIGAELASIAGKRVGIGTSADQDALRGFRPGKNNNKFLDDFQTAAPHMQADPEFRAAGSDVRQQAEALSDVRRNWWKQQVQPIVDKHSTVPLSGIDIRNSIESKIPDPMKKFHPEKAAQVQQFANEFMPGSKFALSIGDAEKDLEYFNAQLADTGYWRKTPSERAAMLKTNPDALMASSAADAIRDELYNRLSIVEPGADMAQLKKTYGSLSNVEHELQGRVNVEGRQAPTSLKELVGLTAGIATGGVHGALAATIPFIDREANTAGRLVQRATQKEATGQGGAVGRAIQKAGGAIEAVAPPAAAVAGENVGRTFFRDSQGRTHSVPSDQLDTARIVDPHLTVIPAPQQ